MKKILIDRNIERNAIICQTTTAPQTVQWGPNLHKLDVLKRIDKTPRPDESFRAEQLPYLAALCLDAKNGSIDFYSSPELMMERMRQKGPTDGYLGLNLMAGIAYKHAVSPINRTIVLSSLGSNFGTTEEEQMEFFKDIDDPRFLEIRRYIPENHVDDAFHLWTAEKNNLHCFWG